MCSFPARYSSGLTSSTLPMLVFFFNDTATTEIYTLSLHDALPICVPRGDGAVLRAAVRRRGSPQDPLGQLRAPLQHRDAGSRLDEGRLRVKELDRLLVDLHVLAVRDGRRLGRAHEVAPAPR